MLLQSGYNTTANLGIDTVLRILGNHFNQNFSFRIVALPSTLGTRGITNRPATQRTVQCTLRCV